ncbi:MAG: energy transducer TonB [Pelagibaca sp.]
MRVLEITTFIVLSGALHAATLYMAPVPGGATSGGAAGTAEVTLQAATPTLAAMVQDWDRPPETSDAPMLAAPEMTTAPKRPTRDAPVLDRPQTTALVAPSPAPDVPQAETRLPAPPVPFADTTPDTLPVMETPRLEAPDLPIEPTAKRPEPPQPPTMTDTAPTAPQVDTAPAAERTAPTASLRPEPRPERREPAQTRSQPAQTAKGSGTQQTASPKPAPKPQAPRGPSQAQLAQLEQQWGAKITSALRRAHRPPRGAQGSVTLVIAIAPSGQVAGVSVAASSGNARLDQSALAAVKRARFPRAPDGLTRASYRFSQRLTVAR